VAVEPVKYLGEDARPMLGAAHLDEEERGSLMPTIVVGVDGSESAEAALRFAIGEAKLRGERLRVICAWELPVANWSEIPPPEETYARFRQDAEEIVAQAVAKAKEDEPSVECEGLAVEGAPGSVLVEHSVDAGMLVVGSRGHGAVAGRLLGSVSHEVVSKAACPVGVVPVETLSE
jgi:nucleotide-binding universal stress UspA family protein